VRLRYRESDIGRNQRQREFLWGLRDQIKRTNLLANFLPIYNAFQSMVTTDLNPLEIVDLLNWGIQLDPAAVRASGFTLYDLQSYTTPEGASVLRIADPVHVRNVVEGVWQAPAMVDSYRKDVSKCQPLPPGVTYATDISELDTAVLDADAEALPPPPTTEPVAQPEAPAAEQPAEVPAPTPTPTDSAATTSLFPTPTPAPVSLLDAPTEGG